MRYANGDRGYSVGSESSKPGADRLILMVNALKTFAAFALKEKNEPHRVERVLVANQLIVVTKEVVETARQNLIIWFN